MSSRVNRAFVDEDVSTAHLDPEYETQKIITATEDGEEEVGTEEVQYGASYSTSPGEASDGKRLDDDEEEEYEEYGEEDAKAHLRAYSPMMIDQRVFIQRVEGKGRCLFARHDIKPGEIIFVEAPVLAAVPSLDAELWEVLTQLNDQEPLNLPPVWHLGAIISLTKLDWAGQRAVSQKFVPDPEAPPSRDVRRVLEATGLGLDPQKYERALNAWRFNGFGHHAENDGLILYDRISNMAHSCAASATWHYAKNDAFVLRARQHLAAGDEITISYINDEDLLKPTHTRREKLSSWQFVCGCDRCLDEVDRCRGFRCPDCGTGTVFIKTDTRTNSDGEDEYVSTAQPCDVCKLAFSVSEITRYEEFEEAYISRLEETSKDALDDLEMVYSEAGRVFTTHHVMYELDTMMYEAYKDLGMWTEAARHLEKRIDFSTAVRKGLRTRDFWMYEELGDLLSNHAATFATMPGYYRNAIARAYESAFNGLILLCGSDHEYTLAAHAKFTQTVKT